MAVIAIPDAPIMTGHRAGEVDAALRDPVTRRMFREPDNAQNVIRDDNQFALRANLLPRLENGVLTVIASIHRVRIST
jgi:hypothetical protein